MNWISKLERRFGFLAIPHLLRYVALLNALVFVLLLFSPSYAQVLALDPQAVLKGEIWRLITHIFVPRVGGLFSAEIQVLFYLLFLDWIGRGLEEAIGSFRLTLYYFAGVIGTTAAAFLSGHSDGGFLLNNSLLFAFAWFYPNNEVFILLFLPLRVKWLAWIDGTLLALHFFRADWRDKLGVIASLLNFALLLLCAWLQPRRQRSSHPTSRFQLPAEYAPAEALHECSVCRRTELDSPRLEFRVARDGAEYCLEHLPK
ncbi:MAG: hypothetical protein RLZZ399_509 [Verrucomicrobiota bacterium]|jgi:hypothetical protein